jgi:hypothetical protein
MPLRSRTGLREAIERDRFPLSPRIKGFKAILAKLQRPPVTPEPLPPPNRRAERSMALRPKRR